MASTGRLNRSGRFHYVRITLPSTIGKTCVGVPEANGLTWRNNLGFRVPQGDAIIRSDRIWEMPIKMGKQSLATVFIVLAAISPANAMGWNVEKKTDSFTDQQTCRVNFGTDFSRGITEGMLGWFGMSYFFAERRGDEVVAGITNDRNLPIAGEIQIRVDDGPVTTITPLGTPDDYLPPLSAPVASTGYPDVDQKIAQSIRYTRTLLTPYRITSGVKARALLSSIINGHRAIWRSVTMIAAADNGPAEIRIDGLKEALAECGIGLAVDTQEPLAPPK